jgi:hypothetical protein
MSDIKKVIEFLQEHSDQGMVNVANAAEFEFSLLNNSLAGWQRDYNAQVQDVIRLCTENEEFRYVLNWYSRSEIGKTATTVLSRYPKDTE